MVGKATAGAQTRGFATLWTPTTGPAQGRFVDTQTEVIRATLQLEAHSAMLQTVATADAVYAVGFAAPSSGAAIRGVLWVLDPEDLAIEAQLELSGDGGSAAALESVALDGAGRLVVGGSQGFPPQAMEGVKSYGNLVGGQGVVLTLALTPALSATEVADLGAIASANRYDIPEIHSAKSVRFTPDGGLAIVGHDAEEHSGWALVEPDLQGHTWTRTPEDVELTDLVVVPEEDGSHHIALVGHGGAVGIDGQVRLIDSEGAVVWSTAFGNPGVHEADQPAGGLAPDSFVFDECWGIAVDATGTLVAACGSGIEGCGAEAGHEAPASARALCRSDPRQLWRTHLVGLDLSGSVLWARTDAFVRSDEVAASAAEYVVTDDAGMILAVVDHDFGIGLARYGDAER